MGYVLKYESARNVYSIGPAHTMKGLDHTKITEEVRVLAPNVWICRTKKPLLEQSERHATEQILKYEQIIKKIKNRTVEEVKQSRVKHG